MYNTYEAVMSFLILLFLALLGFIAYAATAAYKVEQKCLSMGYPSYSYSMGSPSYCIKRQDQSDVVLPLGK